ncbi:MAG: hypothetical protein ACR2QV_05810 [Gammaproteobacteria bacterium]
MGSDLALLLLALLLLGGVALCAEPETATTAGDEPAALDAWYPRTITGKNGSIIVQAPQIDAWKDFESIVAWVAFEIKRADSNVAWVGSLKFEAATATDVAAREVLMHDFEILEVSIDGLADDAPEYQLVRDGVVALSRKIPLDLVLEYLPQGLSIADDGELQSAPPLIFVSERPAVLLSVAGEPIFVSTGVGVLQFVLNTNWDVLRVGDQGALFMCYEARAWLTAPAIAGPWKWADALPPEFASVPDNSNWTNVRDCLPDDLDVVVTPAREPPPVFHATEPAELIVTDGAPQWLPIGDTGLAYATNTTQEMFRADDGIYLLLSGRWFGAFELDGPWALVRDLPAAFLEIPVVGHPKSYVRASVTGTRESREAALVASIPRTAEIVRGTEAELGIDVSYAGEPVFAPIEGADVELAINTSYQVLRYRGSYYLCHNAVWLTSSEPTGPWQYADKIPAAFAKIPPSSPAYNTTFVKVRDRDDEVVEYEYTSGYEGAYVQDETVVSGTGYSSAAFVTTFAIGYYGGSGYPYYPYYPYYWWPPTYGYGSWYNPSTGRYGESVVAYGPYGAAGGAAVYNPETGVYARGQGVWDSDEFAGRGFAYNPNTDTSLARNRYVDYDNNEGWSQGVARRGDEWRYKQSEWQDGVMQTEFGSSLGTEGQVERRREGDAIVSEGTVTGDNRSATFESRWEDGQGSATFEGSEGGSGELDREVGNGQVTGSGEFTKDGKTIDTDVTRTAEGVKRDFETSGGGEGTSVRRGDENAFAYQSGSGDMYAGRDGEIYKKTDDGWSAVENPRADASAARAEGAGDSIMFGGDREGAGYGRATDAQIRDRNAQLDRDSRNRQNGFDRYSSHQRGGGRSMQRGGGRMQRGGFGRRR